jgi:MOSC domain-containing protein YiiM
MTELRKEAYGPVGDAARHLSMADLQAGVRALPKAPSDLGMVTLIVSRQADGVRLAPEEVHLTPEEGVAGDGWNRRPPRDPDGQIAVIRRDVAELIANGQPLTVFGDNFIVELDLSAGNLPAGTRLGVGEAVVEVTAKPHNGCLKFRDRFGKDALSLVQAPQTRHWNLRGIYWKVVQGGRVAPASPIRVLSRP